MMDVSKIDADCCENVLQENEKNLGPDVVLMDINMPKVDGIEGLKQIKHFSAYKSNYKTAYDDSEKIFLSISNGASGYILKSDKLQEEFYKQ